ncbi:IS66 family element, transposase domain protein (plasmid) [Acinetobacter baumannii Naval-18]|nr:IS66 family element, transposase domain protein [Acinetobacter baumannii Naval-18]
MPLTIEAELRKKTDGTAEDRREYRQQHSQPVMQQLYEWLNQHHLTVPSSSPTAKVHQLHSEALASLNAAIWMMAIYRYATIG